MRWRQSSIIIFLCISCIWIILQLFLFQKCMTVTKELPLDVLCEKEKALLFLHMIEFAKSEHECTRFLKKAETIIHKKELPTIFVVTPTYHRPVQKAELTRMSHTLLLVPKIFWIVVEDSHNKTDLVKNFLANCQIPSAHLNVATPDVLTTNIDDPNWLKPRGVLQRNEALIWLRKHYTVGHKGVVYFADDDNTYDLEVFKEMRYTKTVSVWPVGLVGGLMVEKPIVENGKVVGWNTLWKTERPFPIDMAGFAVNLSLLLHHQKAAFSTNVPRGYQESKLLKDLVTVSQLEPKADNCTKVLVWHTRTEKPKLKQEKKLNKPSNFGIEV